jgi:hypothetical protein
MPSVQTTLGELRVIDAQMRKLLAACLRGEEASDEIFHEGSSNGETPKP